MEETMKRVVWLRVCVWFVLPVAFWTMVLLVALR